MSLTIVDGLTGGRNALVPAWRRYLKHLSVGLSHSLRHASRQSDRRSARRELLGMSDHLLADIGINRGEIDSVVSYGGSDLTRVPRGRL